MKLAACSSGVFSALLERSSKCPLCSKLGATRNAPCWCFKKCVISSSNLFTCSYSNTFSAIITFLSHIHSQIFFSLVLTVLFRFFSPRTVTTILLFLSSTVQVILSSSSYAHCSRSSPRTSPMVRMCFSILTIFRKILSSSLGNVVSSFL
jgi:hypothetical protein